MMQESPSRNIVVSNQFMNLEEVWRNLRAPVADDLETDWCASPNYFSTYVKMSAALSPGSIFEIGTRVGHTLISMCLENPRIRAIRWVDNETYVNNSNAMAWANIVGALSLHRPDWELPKLEDGTSYPDPIPLRRQYDLCHIDGDHSYEGKIRDLEYAAKLEPLWIALDDYEYHPHVGQAIRTWCSWTNTPLVVIKNLRGMALITKHQNLESWTIDALLKSGLNLERIVLK